MINHWANEIDRNCTVFEILLISFAKVGRLGLRPNVLFQEIHFLSCLQIQWKINSSSCINDETCLYYQFANCSIIQESANVRQASKAWTVRFLANEGGEQKFNLWQSCKILLALTIFSKMFLWLQIWDRLRVPVLLLLQELSRLRLGDRRVSVQPGQSWWHVFVKLVTRFVKLLTRFV